MDKMTPLVSRHISSWADSDVRLRLWKPSLTRATGMGPITRFMRHEFYDGILSVVTTKELVFNGGQIRWTK